MNNNTSKRKNKYLWFSTLSLLCAFTLLLLTVGKPEATAVYAQDQTATPLACTFGSLTLIDAQQATLQVSEERCSPTTNTSHYFYFLGKKDKLYSIRASSDSADVDVKINLYDENTNLIASNDDASAESLNAEINFEASADGAYYVQVINQNQLTDFDPAEDIYTLLIDLITTLPNVTPSPEPTVSDIQPDGAEDNFNFDTAFVIAPNEAYDFNFAPINVNGNDNDFFKMWVKTDWFYSCETFELSSFNDTNMIVFDQNGNEIGGNDDLEPGSLASLVSYAATYTGWIYILVGPAVEVPYTISDQFSYRLICESVYGAPTATPRPFTPSNAPAPTATPTTPAQISAAPQLVTPQSAGTLTELDDPELQITIQPLTTDLSQEITLTTEDFSVNVTIEVLSIAEDGTPSLTIQGVSNIPIALYSQGGELLAFGYTDNQGGLLVKLNSTTSQVSVVIPYFGIREQVQFSQTRALNIQLPPVELASDPSS